MVANWIDDDNLRLFVEAVAHFSGASFDEGDWAGLEYDLILRRDPLDGERHVERPLGERTLDLFYEPGSSAVSFQLNADAELELRADTLAHPLRQVVVHADR